MATKWKAWNLNPGSLNPESVLFNHLLQCMCSLLCLILQKQYKPDFKKIGRASSFTHTIKQKFCNQNLKLPQSNLNPFLHLSFSLSLLSNLLIQREVCLVPTCTNSCLSSLDLSFHLHGMFDIIQHIT